MDAHGDINTPETTASGNMHGMPVALLLRWVGEGGREGGKERAREMQNLCPYFDGPNRTAQNMVCVCVCVCV